MIFIGDVHGKFADLARLLAEREISNSTLIQVGDFGVGFLPPAVERAELEALNGALREANNALYAIRGNHDDPSYFTSDGHYQLSNIYLLPDYSLLNIGDKRVLLVGGAVSIDRAARVEGISWWPKEVFHFDVPYLEGST